MVGSNLLEKVRDGRPAGLDVLSGDALEHDGHVRSGRVRKDELGEIRREATHLREARKVLRERVGDRRVTGDGLPQGRNRARVGDHRTDEVLPVSARICQDGRDRVLENNKRDRVMG